MADQKSIITEAANRYGVRPDVLFGLYGTETSFGHNVSTSSAGAVGPFQFLPSTAKSLGVNPYDFKSAAFGAAKYLGQYKGRGLGGMLSAYNAGPGGGYQADYVNKTLQNAKSYGSAPSLPVPGIPGASRSQGVGAFPGAPSTSTKQVSTFDEAGFRKASSGATIGKLYSGEDRKNNPLFTTGILSTREPSRADYQTQRTIPGAPAQGTPAPPQVAGPGKLGGFLSASAPLEVKRLDEGQDIQTRPGEALLAPGDGTVIAVKSDPSGFGPSYPVVKFTSGRMAGLSVYLGHADSALRQGDSFKAGQTIARTSKTGHNAPPGWAEIGLGNTLGQGNKGQGAQIAPYLTGKR